MNLLPITIVIPTRNEEKNLPRLLISLCQLNYPKSKLELIVVDGGSLDNTVAIAQKAGARVYDNPLRIRGAGCKIGVGKARFSLIAFTDADCTVPRNWLTKLLAPIGDDQRIAAVGGPNITPKKETDFGKAAGEVLKILTIPGARYGYTGKKIVGIYHNPGCNVLYRKQAIMKVGNFNPQLLTCEDEELDFRLRQAGYKLLFTPRPTVDHYRRLTYKKIYIQAYRYAIGRAQAIKLHPPMARWFHFVPTLTILSIAGLLPASLVFGLLAVYLSMSKKYASPWVHYLILNCWFWGYGIGFLIGQFK